MFAEAGIGVFWIKGVNEQGITRCHGPGPKVAVEERRLFHVSRAPAGAGRSQKRCLFRYHVNTLHRKVLSVYENLRFIEVGLGALRPLYPATCRSSATNGVLTDHSVQLGISSLILHPPDFRDRVKIRAPTAAPYNRFSSRQRFPERTANPCGAHPSLLKREAPSAVLMSRNAVPGNAGQMFDLAK